MIENETFDYFFVFCQQRKLEKVTNKKSLKLNLSKVYSQPRFCGPHPTKTDLDCCEDLNKLVRNETVTACHSFCGMNFCCMGYCVADGLGFLKNGKFNRDTAISVAKKAFANNPEWHSVRIFLIILDLLTFFFIRLYQNLSTTVLRKVISQNLLNILNLIINF